MSVALELLADPTRMRPHFQCDPTGPQQFKLLFEPLGCGWQAALQQDLPFFVQDAEPTPPVSYIHPHCEALSRLALFCRFLVSAMLLHGRKRARRESASQ